MMFKLLLIIPSKDFSVEPGAAVNAYVIAIDVDGIILAQAEPVKKIKATSLIFIAADVVPGGIAASAAT